MEGPSYERPQPHFGHVMRHVINGFGRKEILGVK
jgi:hypothetical protein